MASRKESGKGEIGQEWRRPRPQVLGLFGPARLSFEKFQSFFHVQGCERIRKYSPAMSWYRISPKLKTKMKQRRL